MGVTTDLLRSSIGIGVLGVRWLVKVVTFQRWRRLFEWSFPLFTHRFFTFTVQRYKTLMNPARKKQRNYDLTHFCFCYIIVYQVINVLKILLLLWFYSLNTLICQSVNLSRCQRGGISRTKYYIKNKYINIFIFYKEKSGALLQESPPLTVWQIDRLTDKKISTN